MRPSQFKILLVAILLSLASVLAVSAAPQPDRVLRGAGSCGGNNGGGGVIVTSFARLPARVDGCPPPPVVPASAPVSSACTIAGGGVVGDLPVAQQAYYAPGKIAPDVVLKAGTYTVTGIALADDGQFYRIILACQYLYVPLASMQPSYQPPQNGEPLPTNIVS